MICRIKQFQGNYYKLLIEDLQIFSHLKIFKHK